MNPLLVENRIRYFLKTRHRGRHDVRLILKQLKCFGRLVLVGGILRDLALFGNANFKSDLDFVIDPYNLIAFEKYMETIGARVNRFGGYALPLSKWQIDIWPLQRTWAHVNGHAKVKFVGDLRNVTFFKCDAIIYDLNEKKIQTQANYFNELNEKILEINLEPNPNRIGNAVRAFRYSTTKGFRWGPQLSRFVAEIISDVGLDTLREAEMKSFRTRYLDEIDLKQLNYDLNRHLSRNNNTIFDPTAFNRGVQLELPIDPN